jgi:hypothetical protein
MGRHRELLMRRIVAEERKRSGRRDRGKEE